MTRSMRILKEKEARMHSLTLILIRMHNNRRNSFLPYFRIYESRKFGIQSNFSLFLCRMKSESERHFYQQFVAIIITYSHRVSHFMHWNTKIHGDFFFAQNPILKRYLSLVYFNNSPFNASPVLNCVISIFICKMEKKVPHERDLNVLINYIWFDALPGGTNWSKTEERKRERRIKLLTQKNVYVSFTATNFTWYLIKYANCRSIDHKIE